MSYFLTDFEDSYMNIQCKILILAIAIMCHNIVLLYNIFPKYNDSLKPIKQI